MCSVYSVAEQNSNRIERPFERQVELDVAYKRESLKSASGLIGFITIISHDFIIGA